MVATFGNPYGNQKALARGLRSPNVAIGGGEVGRREMAPSSAPAPQSGQSSSNTSNNLTSAYRLGNSAYDYFTTPSLAEAEANAPWATEAAGGTGTTAAGTGTGTAASTGTGTGTASGAGYGALGWWALLAALGANAVNRGWYQPKDILTADAPAERWKNMDFFKNMSKSMDNVIGGAEGVGEHSSRMLSADPRHQWEGAKGLAGDTVEMSKNVARQNFEGAKDFSNKTLVDPAQKSWKATKATGKALASGLRNFSEKNSLGKILSGAWIKDIV